MSRAHGGNAFRWLGQCRRRHMRSRWPMSRTQGGQASSRLGQCWRRHMPSCWSMSRTYSGKMIASRSIQGRRWFMPCCWPISRISNRKIASGSIQRRRWHMGSCGFMSRTYCGKAVCRLIGKGRRNLSRGRLVGGAYSSGPIYRRNNRIVCVTSFISRRLWRRCWKALSVRDRGRVRL